MCALRKWSGPRDYVSSDSFADYIGSVKFSSTISDPTLEVSLHLYIYGSISGSIC